MKLTSSLLIFAGMLQLSTEAPAETLTEHEDRLVGLLNAGRAQAGLVALEVDVGLSRMARAHSLDMATAGFFSHSSPTTGEMSDRLEAAAVRCSAAGENIAIDQSVDAAHGALMSSTPHRNNVLSSEFTHVGVGIVSSGGRLIATEAFVRAAPGFMAEVPARDRDLWAAVGQPREEDLVRVQTRLSGSPTVGAEGSECLDVEADDSDNDEGASVALVIPRSAVRASPPPQRFPVVVQPSPMPPPGARGIWIVGPTGAWRQAPQAVPLHSRSHRQRWRYTY